MNFKVWLEGEYGTSAAGPVGAMAAGSTNYQGPNDETFWKRGVRSRYQQSDGIKQKMPPRKGRLPLGFRTTSD